MGWSQITMIILLTLSCVNELVLHGQQRQGKYNFFSKLFTVALYVWLLGKGGFWR